MNQSLNSPNSVLASLKSCKGVLNILIGICAIASIFASYADNPLWYQLLKPLTTILIILLPLLFTHNQSSVFSDYKNLIFIALIFCLAGDIFLLYDEYFAFGLGAFLVAHLLFAFVFFKLSNSKLYPLPLSVLIIIAIAYYVVLLPNLGELSLPVAIYFLCIVIMCWQGFRLSFSLSHGNKNATLVAIAAVLFVVSDSVIAANKFLIPFAASGILILSFYWLSITLLANLFSGSKTAWKLDKP